MQHVVKNLRGGEILPDEPEPTPPDPPVTTTLPDISEYKIKSVEEMSLGGTYLIPCSGVGEGDCVKLVARDGSGGKLGGQVQPFAASAMPFFTIRSSREWKVITASRPPLLSR